MQKPSALALALLLIISMPCSGADIPDNLLFITEEYPPFSYLENNIVTGLSTDLVIAASDRMGYTLQAENIQLMAWPDAYQTAQTRNNTILFSVARTTERESLFSWAGPIFSVPIVLFASNRSLLSDMPPREQLKVVAIRNDIGFLAAERSGIQAGKIAQVVTASEALQRVVSGTADVWAYARYPGEAMIATLYEDPSLFYVLEELEKPEFYLAFQNQTDQDLVQAFDQEFREMKQNRDSDGISPYERIVTRYIGADCVPSSVSQDAVTDLAKLTAHAISIDAVGTIAEIQEGRHPYKNRDNPNLYAFVYDISVTLIADASSPGFVSKNLAGTTDASGKKFRDEIVRGALKNGSGWEHYVYSHPKYSGVFSKEAYYILVTGSDKKQYIVCAARYLPCDEK